MIGPITLEDMAVRLAVAVGAGLLLGLDRELRGTSAGLRTHALVSLSAAVSTVSALLLFEELHAAGRGSDPLRVMQGLAQAIGFIAAGVIFSARGGVHNLTTAANLWLAAVIGIAAGAGQHILVLLAVAIGAAILVLLRAVERLLPGSRKSGDDGSEEQEEEQAKEARR